MKVKPGHLVGKTLVGRPVVLPTFSKSQARDEAWRLMAENRLTEAAYTVIQLVAHGGLMTAEQLAAFVSRRTLSRYVAKGLLIRTPPYHAKLRQLGLRGDLATFALGAVGAEIASMAFGIRAERYEGFFATHVAHDVACNEVVLRIVWQAQAAGYETIWLGKRAATVPDERGAPALEPDAFLVLNRNGQTRRYLIEFHNEDSGRRVADKIARYESIYDAGRWREVWGLGLHDPPPRVLVVYRFNAVNNAYESVRSSTRFKFLGKAWSSILADDLRVWRQYGKKYQSEQEIF